MRTTLDLLKGKIDSKIVASALVSDVRNGSVKKEQYIAYMSDVYSYAKHSSKVIGLAASRLVLKNPELSTYLFQHAVEELGHEKWAAQDLVDLGLTEERVDRIEPSPPCRQMIALEYYCAAHGNPASLLGWMFVLECLGGSIGGSISSALDRILTLDGKGIWFLSGHGEADSQHSADLYQVISEHLASEDVSAFVCMAHDSIDAYISILNFARNQSSVQAIAA